MIHGDDENCVDDDELNEDADGEGEGDDVKDNQWLKLHWNNLLAH